MRRWRQVGLVLICLLLVFIALFVRAKRIEREHQAAYQAVLESYRKALTPGTTRERVEDFLRARGAPFQRRCCEVGVFSDLTKIGQESPNLVCREWNVYIEFHFESEAIKPETAIPFDMLKRIDFYQDGICL